MLTFETVTPNGLFAMVLTFDRIRPPHSGDTCRGYLEMADKLDEFAKTLRAVAHHANGTEPAPTAPPPPPPPAAAAPTPAPARRLCDACGFLIEHESHRARACEEIR